MGVTTFRERRAFAIGQEKPTPISVETDLPEEQTVRLAQQVREKFDFRLKAMIEQLGLLRREGWFTGTPRLQATTAMIASRGSRSFSSHAGVGGCRAQHRRYLPRPLPLGEKIRLSP
jgi:hypothetical protein